MTFAFSYVVVLTDGTFHLVDGSLFKLPPELCSNVQLRKYAEVAVNAWSRCDLGYWIYAAQDGSRKIVVPGLYLTDGDRPRKRFPGYGPIFSRPHIERYTHEFIKERVASLEKAEAELTSLVHDLRHLSHSIYHSALEAEQAASRPNNIPQVQEKIKSIIASQGMLKVRIDYLDFANSVDRFSEIEEIPVYSRVDKVKRCFSSDAKTKNIDLHLRGTSFRLAHGPNILDIVTYTFVENAIKYSPNDQHVEIEVEDFDASTRVSVTSLGPKIEADEYNLIFERGGRGRHANSVRPSGTGLGLSVAKEIVDIFSGTLKIEPHGGISLIDQVPYQRLTFSFEIPTSGEDIKRKSKILKARSGRRKQILRFSDAE